MCFWTLKICSICYFSREIFMFFTEQKPVYNPWLAMVTCVALGKHPVSTMSLCIKNKPTPCSTNCTESIT